MEHNNKKHLTIIDDNPDMLEALSTVLQDHFSIKTFTEPSDAITFIRGNNTDAVLLDVHIPVKSGFEIYEEIKNDKANLPVLFLTGDASVYSLIKGLDLGGDDFLRKPIHHQELVARISNKINLRNSRKRSDKLIRFKELSVDLDRQQVTLNNEQLRLTPKEYQLLIMLAQSPNKVIHKEHLIQELWKDVHVEVNNLDTHFSNLRKKLKPFSTHIKTLKNLGYVLRV